MRGLYNILSKHTFDITEGGKSAVLSKLVTDIYIIYNNNLVHSNTFVDIMTLAHKLTISTLECLCVVVVWKVPS